MYIYVTAEIVCSKCEKEISYKIQGTLEDLEFEIDGFSDIEENALSEFKRNHWHRETVLDDWLCPDCK